jgi:hypothetical protein
VKKQAVSVQCENCERWFRSRGLAVHMCRRQDEEEQERGAQIADVRPGANDGDCVQGVQQGLQMTEQP